MVAERLSNVLSEFLKNLENLEKNIKIGDRTKKHFLEKKKLFGKLLMSQISHVIKLKITWYKTITMIISVFTRAIYCMQNFLKTLFNYCEHWGTMLYYSCYDNVKTSGKNFHTFIKLSNILPEIEIVQSCWIEIKQSTYWILEIQIKRFSTEKALSDSETNATRNV